MEARLAMASLLPIDKATREELVLSVVNGFPGAWFYSDRLDREMAKRAGLIETITSATGMWLCRLTEVGIEWCRREEEVEQDD